MPIRTIMAITSQEIAAWVFGGGLLVFLGVMMFTKRDHLPPFQERILALFGALLAGLFAFFITGTIAIEARGIQAAGGLAMFVFVRLSWRTRTEGWPPSERSGSEPAPVSRDSVASQSGSKRRLRRENVKPKTKNHGLSRASFAATVTVVIGGLLAQAVGPGIDEIREFWNPHVGLPAAPPSEPAADLARPTNRESVSVMQEYYPSGLMGDIGDVSPTARTEEADQFIYEPLGRSPHEWDYKYIDGTLNERPAKFAGVMYLCPRGNWGVDSNGGRDLRSVADMIRWEARSVEGTVDVEFLIGGITWTWDEKAKQRVLAPYPDSLPYTNLGTKRLTPEWKLFEVDLREKGRVRDDFKRVVGGFGWVITWAANGVRMSGDGVGPDQKKVFVIEIRNIRYERKQQ
jgi:hypothetical protein